MSSGSFWVKSDREIKEPRNSFVKSATHHAHKSDQVAQIPHVA